MSSIQPHLQGRQSSLDHINPTKAAQPAQGPHPPSIPCSSLATQKNNWQAVAPTIPSPYTAGIPECWPTLAAAAPCPTPVLANWPGPACPSHQHEPPLAGQLPAQKRGRFSMPACQTKARPGKGGAKQGDMGVRGQGHMAPGAMGKGEGRGG